MCDASASDEGIEIWCGDRACETDVLRLDYRVASVPDEVGLGATCDTERQLLCVACTQARECLFVSGCRAWIRVLARSPVSKPDDPQSVFRDVPTSIGEYISYFDTILWVADALVGVAGADQWDAAEEEMREHLERGDLVAWGRPCRDDEETANEPPHRKLARRRTLERIPPEAWPALWVDITSGQSDRDAKERGRRYYGEALWQSPDDEARVSVAWTNVCFRKVDVFRHWPAARPDVAAAMNSDESAATKQLARMLRESDMKKDQARQRLRQAGFKIGTRGFQNWVWPQARVLADLPAKGRPGPKSKAKGTAT